MSKLTTGLTANSLRGAYEDDLTVEDLNRALPTHMRFAARQDYVDMINNMVQDPQAAEQIRNNFISYTGVLKDARYRPEDYLNAVAYVSFKLMDNSNQESYRLAFPQRYNSLVARGATEREISSYVAAYNRGKLVNAILEQTLIPTWVLNQDLYQKAINTQAGIMADLENSARVRSEAADSLLTHLKRPETQQVELNIAVQESNGMTELKDTLALLAAQQRDMIGDGMTTKEIAHQKLGKTIDITPTEVDS